MNHQLTQASPLAVEQGQPVRTIPMSAWPEFDEKQIEAVTRVLRSGKVNYSTGEEGRLFEKEFASAVGTEHAVAVANGTLALELALHSLQIGPGDEVVVPCRTFVATASAVVVCGATPIFADVDPVSQNITAESILDVLTPRTKAVIVVHLAGWPCDMNPILELAREYELKVIEDCAQAHAATYHGRPVGSIGDVGAFSFCQDKILTTGGEGGMLTTNDHDLWQRAWSYKDHGKSWDAVYNRHHPNVFRWLHESIGSNWRLTEVQSAIGREALRRLDEWVETRRRHAAMFDGACSTIEALRVTRPPFGTHHSYYKYYTFIRPHLLGVGWTRDRIVAALQAEGIPCGSGICPEVYREQAFSEGNLRPCEPLPVASRLGETSLMFLVHPTLSEAEIEDSCRAIAKVFSAATTAEFQKKAA